MLVTQEAQLRKQTRILPELVLSLIKIAIVLIVTLSFVFYLTHPPSSNAFFTSNTQSDTIVREVRP